MADDLAKFAEEIEFGVQIQYRDFDTRLYLSTNSYNTTQGIQEGHGPRYGMAPIPGQSTTDGTASDCNGLRQSEASSGSALKNRQYVFGVYPITLGTYGDINSKKTHFIWVVGINTGGSPAYIIDFIISSTGTSSPYQYVSDIAGGLHPTVFDSFGSIELDAAFFQSPILPTNGATTRAASLANLSIDNTKYYVPTSVISVSGKKYPAQWFAGLKVNVGTSTKPMEPEYRADFGNARFFGLPSFFNQQNITNTSRTVKFYDLNATAGAGNGLTYEYDYNSGGFFNTAYIASFPQALGKNLDVSVLGSATVVNRLDGGTPALSTGTNQLVNDPSGFIDSSFSAIFSANGGSAMAAVFQDWQRNTNGTLTQLVDLTNIVGLPINKKTLDWNSGTAYTENSITKSTCFKTWTNFDGTTPLPDDSDGALAPRTGIVHLTLGAAGSGILRANTVYEFTYSLYNKVLNHESNVGDPAKFLTGNNDFVALSLIRDEFSGGAYKQRVPLTQFTKIPVGNEINSNGPTMTVNYYEFRFYYRELGTFEWLPALFIDAAQFLYYPNFQVLWSCQGAIAALPGGQPGGFNDYSLLPKANYIDVKTYQQRVFWFSRSAIYYSNKNDPFSYSGRNSLAAPAGEFRGGLPHTYPGQSVQSSRMVIFGSQGIYQGQYTGQQVEVPVQVSPDTTGSFPLDGSDFQVNFWTSYTAFSSRSAIVAEGILYYWGEKGIFRDDGLEIPTRISLDIEPYIFTVYDASKIDQINATYSDSTKEIIWAYDPQNSTDNYSHAIIYNTVTKTFVFGQFNGKIDAMTQVPIQNTSTSHKTDGLRTIMFGRESGAATIQRAYYYDYRNRSGDIFPKGEFLVKTVGALSATNTVQLTLAGGFDAATFAAIAAGDTICIQQAPDYAEDAMVQDFIGTVVSTSSPNIVVNVPTAINSYFSGSLTNVKAIPLYVAAKNGIPYVWESNVWVPGGMDFWAFWVYMHLFFKVNLLPSVNSQTTTLSYRTPVSKQYVSNTLTFSDNSLGNFQVYTSLKNTDRSFDGQGLKLKLSGTHIGSQWVLQYLSAQARFRKDQNNLREFEG